MPDDSDAAASSDLVLSEARAEIVALMGAGCLDDALACCERVVERFRGRAGSVGDSLIADILARKGLCLLTLGRPEDALEPWDELISRFGDPATPMIRQLVLGGLTGRGGALEQLGRASEAVASYEEALSLVAASSDMTLSGRAIPLLLNKARIFANSGRHEETIVVVDSALSAYRAARTAGHATKLLGDVVQAILLKLYHLCELDRGEEARELGGQLTDILGDVGARSRTDRAPEIDPRSESSLAGAVAGMINDGECWSWFEAAGQTLPSAAMAERAVELYRLCEPWAGPEHDASSIAIHAAAAIVRDVADGYALLAGEWAPADRAKLPLPKRAESQRAEFLLELGIDKWAAEHGHPLTVSEARGDIETNDSDQLSGSGSHFDQQFAPEHLVRYFLNMAYTYELLGVLFDSVTGRKVLKRKSFRKLASSQLLSGRKWLRRLTPTRLEESGVAAVGLFVAEGLFLASYEEISASGMLFPPMSALRGVLRDSGGYDWLVTREAPMPVWVTGKDE
jgi:tetratricopeptide (TPR) repeat protein